MFIYQILKVILLSLRDKKGKDMKMKAKNVKLEMVSLPWCESTKGLKKEGGVVER